MKVVIIGAGVAGITTAYFLSKNGCQVTLLDQHQQPGYGSSYGNGGQLSYNYSTPIATPQTLKQLPKILLGFDPAFKILPSLDVSFYTWALRYLHQCLPAQSNHSATVMKKLGLLAQTKLVEITEETGIHFDLRKHAGKIYLYRNQALLNQSDDGAIKACSREEVYSQVPGLNPNIAITNGLLDFTEDAGDSHQFCIALSKYLEHNYSDFTLLTEHKATSVDTNAGHITAIHTDKGTITGDSYIVSMGAQSTAFTRTLGIKLPIYPMKGYSVTVPATDACPTVSVTDTANKMVYCRLGNRLRIAGFAEFSGYDTTIKQSRINFLLKNARQLLPEAGDYNQVLNQWCGLRPATPDSLPIVSHSPYKNLFLNTGHGMLGWTYSSATAEIICQMLMGKNPQNFDVSVLQLKRFSVFD